MKIILASSSPRRKELLSLFGIEFECVDSNLDESQYGNLSYRKMVKQLSIQKAMKVAKNFTGDRVVIGSDTIVVLNKRVFGKPSSAEDAIGMLTQLSGKTNKVVTGLSVQVYRGNDIKIYNHISECKVKFDNLTNSQIKNYVLSGEPMDKAGAYAMQGKGGLFIKKLIGNYHSVIGLPTNVLMKILTKEGILD